jgi:heme/copper-type cytochrome/quinol oxidase subunit 1
MNSLGDGLGSSRAKRIGAVALAAALALVLLAGLVLVLLPSTETYGWFAYAPLSQQYFMPDGLVFLGARARIGIALIVVALLGAAFWVGFWLGRRRMDPQNSVDP